MKNKTPPIVPCPFVRTHRAAPRHQMTWAKRGALLLAVAALLALSVGWRPGYAAKGGKERAPHGRVRVVEQSADFRVQVVEHFPDLRVQVVEHFPDKAGRWQFVEHSADFTVQFVTSFPDLRVRFVEAFPGPP